MAADRGEPRRRTIDPIVSAVADGVAAGYRTVESVLLGVSESARMRSAARVTGRAPAAAATSASARARSTTAAGARARSPKTGAGARAAPDMPPPTIVGELADLTVGFLDGLGDAVREIAGHIAERDRFADDPRHHTLASEGAPGETVDDEFLLSNTGPTALKELTFEATDLIGDAEAPIPATAVSFTPKRRGSVERVRPGGSTTVVVAIDIPEGTPPGMYHGVVCARFASQDDRSEAQAGPVGAWALIALDVLPTDPRTT